MKRARSSGVSVDDVARVVVQRDRSDSRGGLARWFHFTFRGDGSVEFEGLVLCFIFYFHGGDDFVVFRLEHEGLVFLGRQELLGAAVSVEVGVLVGVEGFGRI